MPEHSISRNNADSSFDETSDRAIERRNQDLLNRADFAENIARMISKRRGRDSFVVALQGPWGCGKSSIKNMAVEWLREDSNDNGNPIVIEFEPWQYRDSNSLFQAFFDEIAEALSINLPNGQENAKRIKQYGKRVSVAGNTVEAVGNAISLLSGVPVSPLATGISNVLKNHAEHTQTAAEALDSDTKNLYVLKRELRESMRKLDKLVVVVIDDIDRLFADEMAQVFQLIKANADFPNFVYLLIFHHSIVEKSIEKVVAGSGRSYLEKIIQKTISVPNLYQHRINEAFLNALKNLYVGYQIPFELNEHFSHVSALDNGLSDLISSLRDVHRLINALDFSLPLFISGQSVEVNLVDLVSLETLRIYEPDLYALIPTYKSVLLNKSLGEKMVSKFLKSRYGSSSDQQPVNAEELLLQTIIDKASDQNRPAVRQILQRLFPHAEWPIPVPEGLVRWPKEKSDRPFMLSALRVCEEHYFDRYFTFSLTDGELSDAEVTAVLQNVGDQEYVLTQLKSMEERNLAELFLSRLQARVKEFEPQHLDAFMVTLLDFGENLKAQPNNQHFTTVARIEHLIYSLIQAQADQKVGVESLVRAFQATKSIWVPTILVFRSYHPGGRFESLADEATLTVCELETQRKITEAAEKGELGTHPHLLTLLEMWGKGAFTTGQQEAVKGWVTKYIENTEHLIHLLKQFSEYPDGTRVSDIPVNFLHSRIIEKSPILPLEQLTQRIKIAKQENLDDKQQEYINTFLPVFERLTAQEESDDSAKTE